MNSPLLLILSSPSGAGKSTLTKKLLEAFPQRLMFSVSHTTRQKRGAEVDGQDYHFVDRAGFEAMIEEGKFAEWAEVHGNLYGTALSEIDRARELNMQGIVFDVDYQGARQIKARRPDAVGVFILPPSMEELERRLRGRGTDANDVIERRMGKAREEIEHYLFFDYLVVNDRVEEAAAKLRGIILAEGARRAHTAAYAESLLRAGKIG